MEVAPFQIGRFGIAITDPAEVWRERFDANGSIAIAGAFAPDHLADLVARAARAPFADEYVDGVGGRAIEVPQRLGAAISLMLHDRNLLRWVEQATGAIPLRAVAGRLVETRANGSDALGWHDDTQDLTRKLAIVINLSDQPFVGGRFELRHKQAEVPHLVFDHDQPGSMLIFAVGAELEHRVTPITSGGPRRVFAGWFLSSPEPRIRTLVSETR
jgi:hypothetical protein